MTPFDPMVSRHLPSKSLAQATSEANIHASLLSTDKKEMYKKTNDCLSSTSILLNTLPKSGSVSIVEALSDSLGKKLVQISPGYFPIDMTDFRKFQLFYEKKAIAQSHLNPSRFNKKYICRIDKVVIHIRDPRQATLSWLHHLERIRAMGQDEFLLTIDPVLPPNYFSLNFDQKLDYQLRTHLRQSIGWIQSWTDYIDSLKGGHRFMFSTFEDFAEDSEAFFTRLLEFFQPQLSLRITMPQCVRQEDKNFRLGMTNEWESIFSPRHLAITRKIVPSSLIERFSWNY